MELLLVFLRTLICRIDSMIIYGLVEEEKVGCRSLYCTVRCTRELSEMVLRLLTPDTSSLPCLRFEINELYASHISHCFH